ncbi:MAG TPA: TlyA family RNA methyltransferase [Candidatus Limnocylindria bacterium]|nr:TlyA family RNA methyltransferase [Candidatus Limnocylindria bacterium]
MARRVRLDQLLVQRELAPSRERAQALILAGAVRVAGDRADRAAAPVAEDAVVTIVGGPRFVSRGGEKLDGALEDFAVDVTAAVALDVGSSTGGFTDCLLQRGAARVYAVDVGKGQLDWKLRSDPRVRVMEGINAREGFELPEPVDLVVADVSFISLRLALPPSFRHLRDDGAAIALVKPQFEAGRAAVERGGIVRDAAARADAVVAVAERFADAGVGITAIAPSRLAGREGNREIFVHGRKGAAGLRGDDLRRSAERAAA